MQSPLWRSIPAMVVLVGLLTVACGDDGAGRSSTTTAPSDPTVDTTDDAGAEVDLSGVTLRVGVSSTEPVRRVLYTESGAYDGTPYTIEWIDLDGARAAVEAVQARAVDLVVSLQVPAVVLAQGNASSPWTAEDPPFVVIGAETTLADPGFLVIVHADSGIESLTDIIGKRVAYTRGGYGHYFFVHLWREAGLARDDYEEIDLRASEGRAAFVGRSVDVLVPSYRNAVAMIDAGDVTVLAQSSDVVPAHALQVARAGVLDDPAREAAVADLLGRHDVANAWILANPQAVARAFEEIGGRDPDAARLAAETIAERRVPLDDAFEDVLQTLADVFFLEDVIANEIDVRVIVDRRYHGDSPGAP